MKGNLKIIGLWVLEKKKASVGRKLFLSIFSRDVN